VWYEGGMAMFFGVLGRRCSNKGEVYKEDKVEGSIRGREFLFRLIFGEILFVAIDMACKDAHTVPSI
jgi:hypothetical protein